MRVLIPLPRYGFDPTESAVPWKYLKQADHNITFATPDGQPGRADSRMLTGQDLKFLKQTLMATPDSVAIYREMETSLEFSNSIPYDKIQADDYDALFLPGGHDKGMREYLESTLLQTLIVTYFKQDKPVAAICHGTLLVGRSVSLETSRSVLYGRQTTGLTSWQESMAYNMTRLWLDDYYLTYPEIYMADELKQYLEKPADFQCGPGFPVPLMRDTKEQPRGFALLDGKYLSARWPGDAHRFSVDLIRLLSGS